MFKPLDHITLSRVGYAACA